MARVSRRLLKGCFLSSLGLTPSWFYCQGPWTYPVKATCMSSVWKMSPSLAETASHTLHFTGCHRSWHSYTSIVLHRGEEEWIAWDRTEGMLWRDINSPAWWYKTNEKSTLKTLLKSRETISTALPLSTKPGILHKRQSGLSGMICL